MEDYLRLVSVVYESDVNYHGAEDRFLGGPLSHDYGFFSDSPGWFSLHSGTHDDSDSKSPLSHDEGDGLVFPGIQPPLVISSLPVMATRKCARDGNTDSLFGKRIEDRTNPFPHPGFWYLRNGIELWPLLHQAREAR